MKKQGKELVAAKALIRDESDAPVLAAALHSKPFALLTGDDDFYHLTGKTPHSR